MRVLQKIYRPTLEFENAAYSRGFSKIAGIDEAGRGPLAGPVVVAAVILGKNWNAEFQLNDSKQLSAKKRQELFDLICAESSAFKIVSVSPQEIDRLNILQATMVGMQRCSAEIEPVPDYLLVDGNRYPVTNIQGQAVVKETVFPKVLPRLQFWQKCRGTGRWLNLGKSILNGVLSVTWDIPPGSTGKQLLSTDCLQYTGVLSGSNRYRRVCFDKGTAAHRKDRRTDCL